METPRRMPLQDLSLDLFTKTPRNYKRPLSPSRATPLNPAKRRVLKVEPSNNNNVAASSLPHPVPFMLSNMHSTTPTRPSRLGNGLARGHGRSQRPSSPLSSHRHSPSRELYTKSATESSIDPQSRHYPGFDILRDSEPRRGSPIPRVTLPSDGGGSEEDKENVPLKRRAKRLSSKKRLDCLESSRFSTPIVHPERTPLSVRQVPR